MFGTRSAPSNVAQAMEAFGLPDELREQLQQRMAPPPGADDDGAAATAWPENATAIDLFRGMATQWRAGAGGALGLDLAALPIVAKGLRVRPGRAAACIPQLQIMEDEALAAMAEQQRAAAPH